MVNAKRRRKLIFSLILIVLLAACVCVYFMPGLRPNSPHRGDRQLFRQERNRVQFSSGETE